MTKIMFICADNLTRSVIAHYCCEKYLEKTNNERIKVLSAGTLMNQYEDFNTTHLEEMKKMDIDTLNHSPTRLTQDLANSVDLLVSMDRQVQEYIKVNFNKESILFSEIAYNKIQDVKIDWSKSANQINNQLEELVHEVFGVMSQFIDNLSEFVE